MGSLLASELVWRDPSNWAQNVQSSVSALHPVAPLPGAVVFDDVNVIPMTASGLRRAQTVVVRGNRIVAIGPRGGVAVPADALVVDGRRRYLVPGLIDAHVHLPEREDEIGTFMRLFVANGVTTVVNLSGTSTHLRLRAEIERGAALGPRIFTTGPPVGTSHGHPPTTTATDIADAVAAQKRAGYDFVKLQGDVTAAAYHSLIARARRDGIRVVGHAPRNLGVAAMLGERQSAVAHVEEYLYAALFFRRPQRHPLEAADAKIRRLAADTAQAGTAVISTLDVYRRIADQIADLDGALGRPEVKCMPQSVGDRWGWWRSHNTYVRRFGPATLPVFHGNYRLLAQLTAAFQRAGVLVLAGTDAPTPVIVPGFSLHDELRALVAAGFTPHEALSSATVNTARFLDAGRGTLDVGMRADAVLLDANPLDDIAHTSRVAGVLLNGRWLSRSDIEHLVAGTGNDCRARP